ncbi:MAG: exodeoxyribonuclease VII small subunit [Hyphomicrobiales bacterium]|nr:exodeoxyribonuclease VII small subunit [Rickettsiales bacterium]MCP5362072.1 exodeoxyribonuclease VII small subunit [Hyphomicrobiales bacterium]
MSKTDLPADIKKLSFEEALAELEAIVRKLDSGNQNLEDSIKDYTRGTQLKQHCETKLAEAKLKVEKISVGNDGTTSTEPFDPAE